MKAKIVIILLITLLTCLMLLPGCTSKEELECNALVEEQIEQIGSLEIQVNDLQNQASSLNSTLESKEVYIEELLKQQQKQEEQEQKSETAKLEISFSLNPITSREERYCWRVILTEVNGVGVKLDELIYTLLKCESTGSYFISSNKIYDSSEIKNMFSSLNSSYLLPYTRVYSNFCISSIADHIVVITITGTDENDNKIEALGEADLLYQW